jgi:hypothetical protein
MRTETDTVYPYPALGLQVKFGCQQWIHYREPATCIHQKFVGAGMVDNNRHNY